MLWKRQQASRSHNFHLAAAAGTPERWSFLERSQGTARVELEEPVQPPEQWLAIGVQKAKAAQPPPRRGRQSERGQVLILPFLG